MTGDISESDYGMGDYGDGYYSLKPIWLFGANVVVPVNVHSDLSVFAFRKLEASVRVTLNARSDFGVNFSFAGRPARIPLFTHSDEYLGKFWREDVPVDGPWIPDSPFGGGWLPEPDGIGPWDPVGPDMRPNKPWPTR